MTRLHKALVVVMLTTEIVSGNVCSGIDQPVDTGVRLEYVTEVEVFAYAPRFSPDGRYVAGLKHSLMDRTKEVIINTNTWDEAAISDIIIGVPENVTWLSRAIISITIGERSTTNDEEFTLPYCSVSASDVCVLCI